MLALTRYPSSRAKGNKKDTIVLADGLIVIVITAVRGDRVKIAIKAPKDIEIERGELHKLRVEAINREEKGDAA